MQIELNRRTVLISAAAFTLVLAGIVFFFLNRKSVPPPAVIAPRSTTPTRIPQSPEAPETSIRAYVRKHWPTAQEIRVAGTTSGEWHAYFSREEGGETVNGHVRFELAPDFTITGAWEE